MTETLRFMQERDYKKLPKTFEYFEGIIGIDKGDFYVDLGRKKLLEVISKQRPEGVTHCDFGRQSGDGNLEIGDFSWEPKPDWLNVPMVYFNLPQ